MPGRKAVVAGATGLVGRELVRQPLENKEYDRVTAVVRRAQPWASPKLKQVVTDFTNLEEALQGELAGADVFCTLGTTIKQAKTREQFRKVDLEYPLELGRLAQAGGADAYLIVTAMGADPHSRIFYSRVKGKWRNG
ncbi:NAD(P)H-binding protein [Paenibacillus sp. P26]|nr:NAD(P)H-binding protein [Paenibacillus sp. P26]UUZ90452.1 NAD(P)H-binding protein [Paenibacillus sp. P25]